MRTIIGIIAIVALLAAAAGVFLYLPKLEKGLEADVAAFIDALPGDLKADAIRIQYLDKKVEIRGLQGTTTYFEGTEAKVNIALLTLEGCDFPSATLGGVRPIAKGLSIEGLSVESTTDYSKIFQGVDLPPFTQSQTFKRCTGRNLSGNLAALLELFTPDTPRSRFMSVLSTFTLDQVHVAEYSSSTSSDLGPIAIRIADGRAARLGMLLAEDCLWRDATIAVNSPEPALRIETLAMQRMLMPDFITPALESVEQGLGEQEIIDAMFSAMQSTPMVLQNLVLDNLKATLPDSVALSLRRFTFDLNATASDVRFKKTLQGLTIPVQTYEELSPETAFLIQAHGKDLEIDSTLDIALIQDKDGLNISLGAINISEKNLASVDLKADLTPDGQGDGIGEIIEASTNLFLKKGELTLRDKGLSTLLLDNHQKIAALFGIPETPETAAMDSAGLRGLAAAATRARAALPDATKEQKDILEGLANLIETPGALRIVCTPPQPVPLGGELQDLGAVVTYTPGQ